MAISVDEIYKLVLKLTRKNQAGGVTSYEFEAFWNTEQRVYQDDLLGRFQLRNNGKEGLSTGLIENETIMTKLTPFTKQADLSINFELGNKPDDFIYTLDLRINNAPVKQVKQNALWAMFEDVIDPPSIVDNKYYYTEFLNSYQFYPQGLSQFRLDYISTPVDITWGFTFDGNGRQVYNPATSVQPQWDNNSAIDITKRALANIGVSFKDADFSNFGRTAQSTGE